MKKALLRKSVALLLAFAAIAPWGGTLLLPEDAFAQVYTSVVPSSAVGGPLRNQAAQQGGTVSLTQAAAGGAISVGACLAAGGISIGGAIAGLFDFLGLGDLFTPSVSPTAIAKPGAIVRSNLPPLVGMGQAVPVEDENTHDRLDKLNATALQILKLQNMQLIQITSHNVKEQMFDCIAWALAKMIWRTIAASIIDWINNGFNGRPAFIQDFRSFFLGIVDRTIGEVIQSDEYLAFLCSPFQLNIRIALAMRYAQRAPTCTLTQIIENVENFARSFQGGGWPAWLQFTVVPVNNPYGGYLTSEAVISFTYQTRLGTEKFERSLNLGGFLSQKRTVCSDYAKPGGGTMQQCREIIVTPGELIGEKASQVIGGGETSLLLADEFNEILDALVVQLLSKALNSLFGLTNENSYQDDYYRYSSFTADLSQGSAPVDSSTAIAQIDAAMVRERDMQQLAREALGHLERSKQQLSQVSACWHSKEAGTSSPAVADPGDRNQAGIEARTSDATVNGFDARIKTYQAALDRRDQNVAALQTFIDRASMAKSDAELNLVLQEFNATVAAGNFTKPNDIVAITGDIQSLLSEYAYAQTRATTEMQRCQYFPMPVPDSSGSGSTVPLF